MKFDFNLSIDIVTAEGHEANMTIEDRIDSYELDTLGSDIKEAVGHVSDSSGFTLRGFAVSLELVV